MAENDRDARARTIETIITTGCSRTDASLIFDVSKHAFDSAFDAAKRIVETAPPNLWSTIMASTLASFATALRDHYPEHWVAFLESKVAGDVVIRLPDLGSGS